jgi:N12 class adenine-specific DNA methylase
MADDNDLQGWLRAIRSAGHGGGGATVAEPEDEELSPSDERQPSLSEMLSAIRNAKSAESEAEKAARAHVTPSTTAGPTLDQAISPETPARVTRMGEGVGRSMIPFEPPTTAPPPPHLVRGPFGQPIPPEPVEEELEGEAYSEREAAEQSEEEKQRLERLDPLSRIVVASTTTPNTMLGPQIPTGPPTFGQQVEAGVLHGATGMRPDLAARVARGTGERPLALEAAISPSATGIAPAIERGVLSGASGLLSPDNLALLASMEGMGGVLGNLARQSSGLYEAAETAAEAEDWARSGEALAKAEKIAARAKPLAAIHAAINPYFTYQMAQGLYGDVKGLKKAIDQGDWQTAAELLGEAIPNGIFTAEGVRNIYAGVARVSAGIEARSTAREAARRSPATTPEAEPVEATRQLVAGEPEEAPAESAETPTPNVPETSSASPEAPAARATAPGQQVPEREGTEPEFPLDQSLEAIRNAKRPGEAVEEPKLPERKTISPNAPPEEKLATDLENAAAEIRGVRREEPSQAVGEEAVGASTQEIPAELLDKARALDDRERNSTIAIQRRLRVGYDMASRIKEQLANEPPQTAEGQEVTEPHSNVGVTEPQVTTTKGIAAPRSNVGLPEPQPINPQEVADLEHELGRPVRAEDVNAIRRRQAAAANVEAGLRGERSDEAARIREQHRATLPSFAPGDEVGALGEDARAKADEVREVNPGLAQVFEKLASGKYEFNELRDYVDENVADPSTHAELSEAVDGLERTWAAEPEAGESAHTALENAPPGGFTEADRVPEPPIVEFRRQARDIARTLPAVPEGYTRLWRGNRAGEEGRNPQFTNDLPGIALPFQKAYGGQITYVDVLSEDLDKYEQSVGAAPGAEFVLPSRLAKSAKTVAIGPVGVGLPEEPPSANIERPRGQAATSLPFEPLGRAAAFESRMPTTPPSKEPESATLPEGEEPTYEPAIESLGDSGERALEEVPSEATSRASGEGPARPEGGEGGTADTGRIGRTPERGNELRPSLGVGEGKVPVSAERGGRAETGRGQRISPAATAGNDYRITDADQIGEGGERTKYADNVAAIRTLKQIELDGRQATPEEQSKLVKYVGWGGLSQVFSDPYSRKWGDEYQELKDLLTDEEYEAARASTPNAHYTSLPVVRGIWDAVRRLGFSEGRLLEPSAGVGHFLGLMPDDFPARRTAIELDNLTGRILKQLYQTADVRIQGFEKFRIPNGFFDLAVGNVPFGDYKVHDPDYAAHRLNIHNYFILKTLDKLRPNGVAALITSSYTLDSSSDKARKLFADRADLVGAIRLPNNAFKGNAGTEVTTDVLFFRKRAEDEKPSGEKFLDVGTIKDSKGKELPLNEYFIAHPEMMLGKMERAGTMYSSGEPALIPRPGQDLAAELAKAIAKLPEKIMGAAPTPEAATIEAAAEGIPEYGDTKPGGLKIKSGKVYRRAGETLQLESGFPKSAYPRLKDMLRLRDAERELLTAELNDRPTRELSDLRGRLNRFYDGFVQKHGYLHSRANLRAMPQDPDLPFLLALEDYDPKEKKAAKADIFTKRTVAPRKPVEHVETAKEAMLVSLAEKGRLDFDHMAQITGRTQEELQDDLRADGLVFHSPEGHWETSDSYLSGNVRKKLAEAQSAVEADPAFRENVEALERVQPKDLTPGEIGARLGAPWVPADEVEGFVRHILGDPHADVTVRHVESEGLWTVSAFAPVGRYAGAQQRWGTARVNPVDLIDLALNQRAPVIYDKGPDDTRVINESETLAAKEKAEELHKEFKNYLLLEPERGARLSRLYNERMNNWRNREYDGSHLTLPGMSAEIKLTPIQKGDIWRAISGGNLGLYEPVGAGKTFIMAATAMEWRRLGLARKPMIVVPNHMVEQWGYDFRRLYPGSNALIATKEDFSAENRKEFSSRIATGDWDAVVMGHNSFGKIGVSDETFDAFMNEQVDALHAYLDELRQAEGKKGQTVKEIEKSLKRLEERIARRHAEDQKDRTITLEDLGIDGLLVDEAHAFKSLFFPTKMGRVPGVPRSDSNRALDMQLKSQYISRLNNGKGLVFATGTPISNTMAEMWNMMRYLDDGRLRELGLQHFDAWAAQFGEIVQNLEVRPEDPTKMRVHARFAKFSNLPELITLFRNTGAMHSQEELKLPKPKMSGGKPKVNEIEPSEAQENFIQELGKRAEAIRKREVSPDEDNMLKVTTDGRKAALDMRMVDSGAADDPDSKLNQVVRNVARIYHEQNEKKGTQLLMLDMGVPTKTPGTFNAYQDIKNKLVGHGIPADEIQFIHSFEKDAAKQGLFDDMNDGNVRILLGSTEKVGVGTNIQKRLFALHHVDAPWRPSDIEQREGRILRQGNTNPEVEIHRYVTKRTFDAYMWQLLQNKNNFITQAMHNQTDAREIEDVDGRSLSYAEAKALATGNPLVMEKIRTDLDVAKLQKLAHAHDVQQFNNRREIGGLPTRIQGQKDAISLYKRDQKSAADLPEQFAITLDGKGYSDRKEAGATLNELLKQNGGQDTPVRIGKFGPFTVFAGSSGGRLAGARSYDFSPNYENPLGTVQSLESGIRRIPDYIEARQLSLENLEKELAERKQEADKPFARQKELNTLLARQREIDDQLKVKDVGEANEPSGLKDEEGGVPLSFLGLQGLYDQLARAIRTVLGKEEAPSEPEPAPEEISETGIPFEAPSHSNVGVERTTLNRGARPGERAINIRLDKLNAPDEVLDEIRQIAKDRAAEINEQRRGKISNAQLREMAAEVGLDVDKISKLPKGRALNPEELLAARMALLSLGDEVRKAAAAARESDSSENLLRLWEAQHKLAAVQKSVSGAVAEAGRALQQQKIIAGALRSRDRSNIERVLEQLGGRELTEEELRLLSEIPEDDRAGYYKFLRNATRFDSYDKLRAYWMANILSTPHAFERKALGDLVSMGMQTAARFARAGVDIPVSKLQGRTREFYFRDAMAETAAMIRALPEGARNAAYAIANGFSPEQAEVLEAPRRYELPGGTKNPLNYPGRMLSAATTMMKTMILRGSIKGQAVRQAIKEGAKGAALAQRAAQLIDDPSEAIMAQAMKDAAIQTFTERPDALARMAIRLRELAVPKDFPVVGGVQPFAFVIPFIQVPWNIAKTSVRFSPLGAVRAARSSARGKPESSNILGQALVGSLIMAALAAAAAEGKLTGAAPKNANDRDAWYSAGNEPYSIKIGNHWVNYLRGTGALALLTAAVAGFHDSFREDNKAPTSEKISQVAALLGKAFVEQSFFQGMSNMLNALEEPERYGERFSTDIAEGFVPFSGALRTAEQALDPKIRNPQGMYEHIASGIPILSKTVPPRLDALGREVKSGSSGLAALAPMPISKAAPESSVDTELARLHGVGLRNIGFAARALTVGNQKIELSRPEQAEYQRMRGSLLRMILERMFASHGYQDLQDDQKVEEVQEATRQAEQFAREQMVARVVKHRNEEKAAKSTGIPYEPPSQLSITSPTGLQ